MRIYIVDDEPQQRSGMERLISAKYQDFDVSSFKNASDCIAESIKLPPDILFSDIRMPHISGLELAEKIKELNPQVVVVLISAYTEFEYARRGIDLGVFAYLIKPINPEEIFKIIEKAIKQIGSEKTEKAYVTEEYRFFSSSEQAMEFALKYISENYKKHISLQSVADRCHYSVSHFSNLFKNYTNMSFVSYLNHYRLEQTTSLLIESKMKISEIASSVGFEDTKYFIRLFIREYGITPKSYRKQNSVK